MINEQMIAKRSQENPRGRPLSIHLVVHAWVDQDMTTLNAALALESLHGNYMRDVGLGWLGTDTKRVVDHERRQSQAQASLFSEDK